MSLLKSIEAVKKYLKVLAQLTLIFFDDQVYYMIRFPLSDFILYIGADHKSHYQRKKALHTDFQGSRSISNI